MWYIDTSVLLPLFLVEEKSPDAWHWLGSHHGFLLHISHWNLTEFSSALGNKTRNREIDGTAHQKTLDDFRILIRNRLTLVRFHTADFQRAADLCDHWQSGLRAGDALHLAIVERNGFMVCTLDKNMIDVAQKLGLNVETF